MIGTSMKILSKAKSLIYATQQKQFSEIKKF
jgi:hypothetical protein